MKYIVLLIAAPIILAACAFDLAHVKFKPTAITACPENCRAFSIVTEKKLTNLPCGYDRTLKKDSKWIMIGTVEAGSVYKPTNQSLTVECSNVFEAYLVMNGNMLNGFYLPVEDGYIALAKTIELEINNDSEVKE